MHIIMDSFENKGGINLGKIGFVYIIKNKLNGRIYIGETKRDIETRFNEHRLDLINGKERNKHLLKEFSEVGSEGFEFQVIIETKEHKMCELVLIELFSRDGIGFNHRRGNHIQKVINGELEIPEEVYQKIQSYLNQNHIKGDHKIHLLSELNDIKENGFQCKADDIYNRDFKNLFLREYNINTRRVDEVRFKKAGKFEIQAQKDLYDFTFEEAEEILFSLNAKSLRSIQNHISRLRKYLEFAIQQGRSVNQMNYYKGKGKKEIASKYLNFSKLY
ncbi:hypothetical protein FZC85_16905 [Rossellomorea aquimaris]|uniref:GIY-YIG domain-containing protein n=2 Tax=Rossellomorea aquimaris TaxID=189382 RepID=A0A5D4TRR1_9BACI|nr:hypothetical protein FZD05_16300 [Rossellomorea aquimaris]TYS83671.1 hypothetical protein FZC85_16905 [Rossellomorea aquimaris]